MYCNPAQAGADIVEKSATWLPLCFVSIFVIYTSLINDANARQISWLKLLMLMEKSCTLHLAREQHICREKASSISVLISSGVLVV